MGMFPDDDDLRIRSEGLRLLNECNLTTAKLRGQTAERTMELLAAEYAVFEQDKPLSGSALIKWALNMYIEGIAEDDPTDCSDYTGYDYAKILQHARDDFDVLSHLHILLQATLHDEVNTCPHI